MQTNIDKTQELPVRLEVTTDAKSTGIFFFYADCEAETVYSMIYWIPNDGLKLHFHAKIIGACSGA